MFDSKRVSYPFLPNPCVTLIIRTMFYARKRHDAMLGAPRVA